MNLSFFQLLSKSCGVLLIIFSLIILLPVIIIEWIGKIIGMTDDDANSMAFFVIIIIIIVIYFYYVIICGYGN